MESEVRIISSLDIKNNKDQNNILPTTTESEAEIKNSKGAKATRLKIKRFLKKKLRRKKKRPTNLNYSQSNFFSRLFFHWARHVFRISNKGTLTHEDVCNVSKEQSIKYNIDKVRNTFYKYNSSSFHNYSLIIAIFLSNINLISFIFILDITNVVLDYARMFFYKNIISLFSQGKFFPIREKFNFFYLIKNIRKYPFNIIEVVSAYIIIKIIRTFLENHIEFNNHKLTAKITNQMIALLTEKIIKSNSFYKTGSVIGEGELLNLAEVDSERIGTFFFGVPDIINVPFKIIISLIFLFKIFGFYFLYVLIILFVIISIFSVLQFFYIENLKKLLVFKDKRMKIVTYVFHTLKCLKLNSLDNEFIRRIREKREDELKYFNKTADIELITMLINSNINIILIIFTLYFFAYSNKEIEISNLFVAFQLINSMTPPLLLIPFFFNRLFSNLISAKRVQNFLENKDEFESGKYQNIDEFKKDVLIKFDNISFGIHKNQVKNKKNKKNKRRIFKNFLNTSTSSIYPMSIELSEIKDSIKIKPKSKLKIIDENDNILLKNIFLSIKKTDFVAIIGSMGSGKSSLINAILNNYQMYMKGSKPIINGEISYCSQQPWITTDTIKNNILFYNKYDEMKYNKIISICQLEKDFDNFIEKDETLINSSSAGLSGGQKARIALARCLYKDADLYLFDDPFSSIDNSVSQTIFQNSFCGYLKNKARILVTNDLTNLINVDKIIYMKKGSIIFTGTFEDYKKYHSIDNLTFDIIKKIKNEDNDSDNSSTDDKKEDHYLSNIDNYLYEDEEEDEEEEKNPYINKYFHSNKGNSVSWKTYLDYIKLQGGYIGFFIVIILIISSRLIESYRRTFVPSLAKSYKRLEEKKGKDLNIQFTSTLKQNLPWYIKISIAGFLTNFAAEFIVDLTSIKSIRNIHEQMIYKLVKAPINLFHDIVPIGQIINHLTKDLDLVQSIIPQVNFFLKLIFSSLASLGLCYIYNRATLWFSPLLILSSFFLGKTYLKTGRCLTRLLRISLSPIMTILNESIKGIDIIRSSHAENYSIEKMYSKLDERFGITLNAEGCLRWYNLRRSLSSQLFFAGILFYMVYYSDNYSAKSIAIILQATEEFITLVLNTSLYSIQLEMNMIGLERCNILMDIETEKNPAKDITKELEKINWPNQGKINFFNFSAGYRPETPAVLKNINIEIRPGDKIGIVGRSGSGKSSIVLSLSRIIEPKKGRILIDDIDIKAVNLEYLRDKLSIVAQDPFLIESTVRDNIDPLHKYTDKEILDIMDDFQLFPKMGKEKLNLKIKENGNNLSLGEKQLISFVRAVIKKNKIVILDEATSSLDTETEKIIQNNLKKYLENSTVIMIAHHLQMVKGCHAILVIDNGEIIEYGSYSDLLRDKNSKLYSLYTREEDE